MPINLLNEGDLNKYLTSIVFQNGEVPHWVTESSEESQKNLQTPDWVNNHKTEVCNAILLQYFKKRIRSYLTKDEEQQFLTSVEAKTKNLPYWCIKALNEGKKVFEFDEKNVPYELKEKLTIIRDYLYDNTHKYVLNIINLAKETDKTSKIRLDYLKSSNEFADFDDVLTYATLWHEKLEKNTNKVHKDEVFYKKSLEGTEFIMNLPNNTFAYKLLTPEALDFESQYMGHCVGQGYYDTGVENGTTEIYSIRDDHGEPHVTFEIDPFGKFYHRQNSIIQCKGKGNKKPVDKYFPAICELIKRKKWLIDDCSDINQFLVLINDEIYLVKDLVNGKVKIPNIINNSICFRTGIEKLPDFSHCEIKGDFDCYSNKLTSLKGAPQKVDGTFNCAMNKLTSLEGAPKEVGKDFYCSNNKLESLKGGPKEVGGSFFCDHNKLTSLNGAPQKVGKEFKCENNLLTNYDDAPKSVRSFLKLISALNENSQD